MCIVVVDSLILFLMLMLFLRFQQRAMNAETVITKLKQERRSLQVKVLTGALLSHVRLLRWMLGDYPKPTGCLE